MKDERILRFALSNGRHLDVPLDWIREKLEPQGYHVIETPAQLVLHALEGASDGELRDESDRDDWRGQVAQAEVGRRLHEFSRTRKSSK